MGWDEKVGHGSGEKGMEALEGVRRGGKGSDVQDKPVIFCSKFQLGGNVRWLVNNYRYCTVFMRKVLYKLNV